MADAQAWNELTGILRDYEAMEGAIGLLAWDQQTMMPRSAAASRGAQLAVLSRLAHERLIDPHVGDLLGRLEAGDLSEVQTASVRNVKRAWLRATRVEPGLVVALAEAQSEAFESWVAAKQAADFSRFAPSLQRLLDLTRERIAAIDGSRHPYDVLLEEYDPGTTVVSLRAMFSRLREGLGELIAAIRERPPVPYVTDTLDVAGQRQVHLEVLRAMGYDLQAGRMDDAEHPFTIGMHPSDVRITTHLYADDLLSGLGGTVHEAGHALYEQGLPLDLRGTFVSKAASFGLHESQSRLWENFIGRSLPFFGWFEGRLRERFPDTPVDAEAMYRGANRVHPGLIRISADEVTYNLHIIVRFEIELALFEGRLAVADLPEAWNERYRETLGVVPPDDASGVLQDVHWASAAFGYFPSYTLGNLYAASLGATLERELPQLWEQVGRGELLPVREWLRERIHAKGHLLDAPERMRAVVGDRDHVEDLLAYLWGRHGAAYGVSRGGR